MKMTVFGATGGIGGHVVRQALDAGHTVTAVVRDAARLEISHPALDVVMVPGLTDPEPPGPALAGSAAPISGGGARRPGAAGAASATTPGILRAVVTPAA